MLGAPRDVDADCRGWQSEDAADDAEGVERPVDARRVVGDAVDVDRGGAEVLDDAVDEDEEGGHGEQDGDAEQEAVPPVAFERRGETLVRTAAFGYVRAGVGHAAILAFNRRLFVALGAFDHDFALAARHAHLLPAVLAREVFVVALVDGTLAARLATAAATQVTLVFLPALGEVAGKEAEGPVDDEDDGDDREDHVDDVDEGGAGAAQDARAAHQVEHDLDDDEDDGVGDEAAAVVVVAVTPLHEARERFPESLKHGACPSASVHSCQKALLALYSSALQPR